VAAPEVDELACFDAWRTKYVSDGRTLDGFFVAPERDGPFPGVLFHHGSGGLLPGAKGGVLALVGMGYAVFLPIRRGHNGNPGPFWETLITDPWGSEAMGPQLVAALNGECDDALAALQWFKQHPKVIPQRVSMIGSSYGGVMVMLAAGRRADFRAGISFAGPSITWPDAPALQEVLIDAMRRMEIPLFLIQAWDDFHLTPTYALGAELAALGKPHETRIYEPIGTERGDGHGVFNNAVELWSPDVGRFLARWMQEVE
jgi:carboxymethylenebutenolidase